MSAFQRNVTYQNLPSLRACLYDPGQAGRDAYRDLARNTNS